MNRRSAQQGYLLIEAIVAMAVLSAGVVAINESLHRAVLLRAISDDNTRAAFFLSDIMGPLEVQYNVPEMTVEGSLAEKYGSKSTRAGTGGLERFRYRVQVENFDLPMPALPPDLPPEMFMALEEAGKNQLRKIKATIMWTRASQKFECTAQTVVLQQPEWTDPQLGTAKDTAKDQKAQDEKTVKTKQNSKLKKQ